MVNAFGWAALGLILFGMVIPFWMMSYVTTKIAVRWSVDGADESRIMRYNEVMDYLHSTLNRPKTDSQCGASLVASIRELKNFPEHRDLSVMYLEEINITGTGKFNDLAKLEIKKVESHLLGQNDV